MKTKTKTVKVPRHIRRDMEKKLEKAGEKLLKPYFHMLKGAKLLAYPENKIGFKQVTVFDKDWMKESGADWKDPSDDKVKRIRVEEFITYEKGRVKIKKGSNALTEAIRTVTVKRQDFEKYAKDAEEILKESLGNDTPVFPNGEWNDGANAANSGKYLPYPPGPYTRQLYLYDQWKMLSRAGSYYNYNSLAKCGVHIKTAFVIGTGPKVQIKSKSIQDAWDQFLETNDFLNRLKVYDRMLTINGEFFGEIFEDGDEVKLRSIDPGVVYEIITEPRDIEKVYGYKLLYSTQYQMYGTGADGKQVPLTAFVDETLPPDNICHLKINVQENEKRGRSDLLPVLDICQLFQDYLSYAVLKVIVQTAFTWDIKMINAEQEQIDEVTQNDNLMFPPPLSTRVHNENVEVTPVQSQGLSDSGRSRTFEELVTAFAVGFLMPKEYMGIGDAGTRATAITATEPAVAIFRDRRGIWESFIRRIVQALAKNQGEELKSEEIEVTWPEIAPENVTEKISNIIQGLDKGFITTKRGAEMWAKEMDVRAYDFDSEMKLRMKELNNSVMQELFPSISMDPFAMGGPFGGGKPGEGPGTPGKTYDSPMGLKNEEKKDIKDASKR